MRINPCEECGEVPRVFQISGVDEIPEWVAQCKCHTEYHGTQSSTREEIIAAWNFEHDGNEEGGAK